MHLVGLYITEQNIKVHFVGYVYIFGPVEKSVNFRQTTRSHVPEDSNFHSHRREKLEALALVT